MNAGNIYDYINEIAPFSAQAEWDNSGFQVGERGQEVKKSFWRWTRLPR